MRMLIAWVESRGKRARRNGKKESGTLVESIER